MIKLISQIARDFKEAGKFKGPERLAATRKCWADTKLFEGALASDPTSGSRQDVLSLRDLIGDMERSLNRLEAGDRRRKINETAK